jgi:hypothetical protein
LSCLKSAPLTSAPSPAGAVAVDAASAGAGAGAGTGSRTAASGLGRRARRASSQIEAAIAATASTSNTEGTNSLSFSGAHDAAPLCVYPCLATAGVPGSACKDSRCLVSADGRGHLHAGLPSLTTVGLRPCGRNPHCNRTAINLRDAANSPTPALGLYTRGLVISVIPIMPRLACSRNARSGDVTSFSFC